MEVSNGPVEEEEGIEERGEGGWTKRAFGQAAKIRNKYPFCFFIFILAIQIVVAPAFT